MPGGSVPIIPEPVLHLGPGQAAGPPTLVWAELMWLRTIPGRAMTQVSS